MLRHIPLLRLLLSANAVNSDPAARPIIAEPATSLTDLILAGQTFFYANRLRTRPKYRPPWTLPAAMWSLAIAAAGVAALAGALTHALHEDSRLQWVIVVRSAAWKIVGLATAAASGFLLASSIVGAIPSGRRAPYLVATVIKAAVFAAAALITGNFLFTILDYATSMLAVLAFQLRNWKTSAAAPWLTGGIVVSFIAAAIQRSHIGLHRRFNHNDLYHVVQMGAFHLLYLGANRQRDGTDESQ